MLVARLIFHTTCVAVLISILSGLSSGDETVDFNECGKKEQFSWRNFWIYYTFAQEFTIPFCQIAFVQNCFSKIRNFLIDNFVERIKRENMIFPHVKCISENIFHGAQHMSPRVSKETLLVSTVNVP